VATPLKSSTGRSRNILVGQERGQAVLLGQAISRLRVAAGFERRRDLAAELKIPPQRLAMIEGGHATVSPAVLNWILKRVGVPLKVPVTDKSKHGGPARRWWTQLLEVLLLALLDGAKPARRRSNGRRLDLSLAFGGAEITIAIRKLPRRRRTGT
jgi:transcriptional regulator with XRE-family HTH domain